MAEGGGSIESLPVGSPAPEPVESQQALAVVPQETSRIQSALQLLKKPRNPCGLFGKCCSCSPKQGCIAIAAAAILLGFGNVLVIYMRPSEHSCKDAYLQKEYFESYPGSYSNPQSADVSEKELDRREEACETMVELHVVSASIFAAVTATAGVLLLAAVSTRRGVIALLSAALFVLAVVLVIIQTASHYFLALARFRDDVHKRIEDYEHDQGASPHDNNPVLPQLPLWTQRALSVLGGLLFGTLYLGFAAYAWLVRQYGLEKLQDNEKNIQT